MRKALHNASPEKAGLVEKHTATAASDSAALENAIFTLLAQRQPGASICPSDAARAVYAEAAQWRAAMPVVRAVAANMVDAGRLVVTQRGQPVDVRTVIGPIRLRLP
jgi:hypothetical protein